MTLALRLLGPKLSRLENLIHLTSIIQNWLGIRLFANVFHHLNSAEEHKLKILVIFLVNGKNDFLSIHILIMNLIVILKSS